MVLVVEEVKEKGGLGSRISRSRERQTIANQVILMKLLILNCLCYIISPFLTVHACTGSKAGNYESPSRDRLVFLTTCLIGHHVEVQVKNGSIYTGIFHATNADKDFGIVFSLLVLIFCLIHCNLH